MAPRNADVAPEGLAQFEDRWTVRYVRLLPAPVPRVWEAVTSADQLNLWFVPVVTLEARLGGRCTLSWGQPGEEAEAWTVTRFEPRKILEIGRDDSDGQLLRFELEPVDATTRFTFTNRFDRRMRADDLELAAANPDNKLLALPAGPDTPIRAGILEGYHRMLDALPAFVGRDWEEGELARASAETVARTNAARRARFEGAELAPSSLAELYYDRIRDHCPPAP